MGGLYLMCSLFPVIHISFGIAMIVDPSSLGGRSAEPPPAFMGWMFLAIGLMVMAFLAALGACQMVVARSLRGFKRHTFCLVVSAFNCLNLPLGTALGVFTILTLLKPSVKGLFGGPGPFAAPYRA
jgi:hypothetical protein